MSSIGLFACGIGCTLFTGLFTGGTCGTLPIGLFTCGIGCALLIGAFIGGTGGTLPIGLFI